MPQSALLSEYFLVQLPAPYPPTALVARVSSKLQMKDNHSSDTHLDWQAYRLLRVHRWHLEVQPLTWHIRPEAWWRRSA